MTLDDFRRSIADPAPPAGLSPALCALWHQGKGDWEAAHQAAQDDEGREAAWVHAHLHRVEGDDANAGYGDRRAGQPHCREPLADEWESVAAALLANPRPDAA